MRHSVRVLAVVCVAFVTGSVMAQTADVIIEGSKIDFDPNPPKPLALPVGDVKKPVVALLEDDAHLLLTHLTNNGEVQWIQVPAASEDVDVFSGASALRVGPVQRFSPTIAGWSFPIVEKPKAGEFRFIRFAWKKQGGSGVMVQLHDRAKTWVARYHAGANAVGWESKQVATELPTEWTVVTRDLFKDFGAMTLTGIAFTAMDGTHALFDHVLLGRSVEDLDAATDEALGKGKPKAALTDTERDALWADLTGRDREKAGPAIRRFLASAPDEVGFMREKLNSGLSPEQARERAATIAKLIADLDADKFDTREAAEEALEKLGGATEAAVVAAAKADSAEVRFRANRLLKKLKLDDDTPPSVVKAARVVRVLERAGTADAKALLKTLSDGEYGAEYQPFAKAAVARSK